VTAANSRPNFSGENWEAKVDSQVAAPAETRTPNWHRAKNAQKTVRMEAWRQRRISSIEDHSTRTKNSLDSDRPSHGGSWLHRGAKNLMLVEVESENDACI